MNNRFFPLFSLRSLFHFLLLLLCSASLGSAQDEDFGLPGNSPQWQSMGGFPGTNGIVYCTEIGPDGKLYVGGSFNIAGTARSFGIARWNGTSWEAISPISTQGFSVHSMAFGPDGKLYVGGSFHDFAGVGALRIAMWDGQNWHAMGEGLGFNGPANQYVQSIAVSPDGVVYAGGTFVMSGSETVNNVARWDGTHWQPLGDGLWCWGSLSTKVERLLFDHDGALYAGGDFTHSGTAPGSPEMRGVAKWDGTSWHPLGSGTGYVAAMILDTNGDLIIGGDFRDAGGIQVNNIARWNGSAWSAFGTAGAGAGFTVAISQPVRALALEANGNILASNRYNYLNQGAYFDVMRWNGSTWQNALPLSARNGPIRSLTVMPSGNIVIGGEFQFFQSLTEVFHANYLTEWDGVSLHRFGNGPNDDVNVVKFDSNGHMIVAGKFQTIGDIQASRIARYDGKRWWPYGSGFDGEVKSIALGPEGEVYAGGTFTHAGGVPSSLVAMWNGGQWLSLSGGIQPMQNSSVDSMVVDPDGDLYVGGIFSQSVSGIPIFAVARWSHGHWHDLDGGCRYPNGDPSTGVIRQVAIDPDGFVVVGGNFVRIGSDGVYKPNLARWNGSSWSSIGPTGTNQIPFDYPGVYVIDYSPSGTMHVGYSNNPSIWGDFNSLVQLQGNTWSQIGNGFCGTPYTMLFDDQGKIFVGGQLNRTGPSPRHNLKGVTYWDGTRWSSLGSEGLGMSIGGEFFDTCVVRSMATDGRGNLVMGGKFTGSTNGVVSPFLIRTNMVGYGYWSALGSLPLDRLAPTDRNGPMNLPNILAYAFGVDPMQATPAVLPSVVLADVDDGGIGIFSPLSAPSTPAEESDPPATIKFQYQRSLTARNVLLRVEASEDLTTWIDAEILSSRLVDARIDWERVEVEVPKSENAQFLRVAAEFVDDF